MRIQHRLNAGSADLNRLFASLSVNATRSKAVIEGAADAPGSATTQNSALQTDGRQDAVEVEGPPRRMAPGGETPDKMPTDQLSDLLVDREHWIAMLTYRAVAGGVITAGAVNLNSAATGRRQSVDIDVESGRMVINAV